jgi:hypothetical protein
MRDSETNPETLALAALGWIVGDANRAQRLLALTGLSPTELRARAGETAVLAAAIAFLEGHEPDLLACAAALGVKPDKLVNARIALEDA